MTRGQIPPFPASTLRPALDGNVRSAYLLTAAALAPVLARNGGGSIINLASMYGTVGVLGGAAHGAANPVVAMTRS